MPPDSRLAGQVPGSRTPWPAHDAIDPAVRAAVWEFLVGLLEPAHHSGRWNHGDTDDRAMPDDGSPTSNANGAEVVPPTAQMAPEGGAARAEDVNLPQAGVLRGVPAERVRTQTIIGAPSPPVRSPQPSVHAVVRDSGPCLTGRELEVLRWLACGLTASAIGHRLGISPRTVRKHLEHCYAKLGCSDRLMAVEHARRVIAEW